METQERILIEDMFGLSLTDICGGALERLSHNDKERLEEWKKRLKAGEPVQYVTGKAPFCGYTFHVAPGVLIPRPETEELVEIIIAKTTGSCNKHHILDVGTGSGCIAITLALRGNEVTAWDISDNALRIAKENAVLLNAKVTFEKRDVLQRLNSMPTGQWDIIVSNPPYICKREAAEMECNVLDYEPHEALFVPDDQPLLFYDAIARYGIDNLRDDGMLAFEINPLFAEELTQQLTLIGYHDIEVRQDFFGKERFIFCYK